MLQALRELARELGLEPVAVERILGRARTAEDPRVHAVTSIRQLARLACDGGDHQAELRLAEWRLSADVDRDVVARAEAWTAQLDALGHLLDQAADGRGLRLAERHGLALEAFHEVEVRFAEAGASPAVTRRMLDPIASIVLEAEQELGLPPSAPAAELAERRRLRAARTATGPMFAARHAEDLAAFRAAEAREWYGARFAEHHGVAPPANWWLDGEVANDTSSISGGGSIAPEAADLLDAEDHLAFLEETEARFRDERGLPARGEGWVSANSLARCLRDVLPEAEIVREATRPWLGRQRLDILVPELDVAIEYQGEQHYLPLQHWGGDAGLVARRELDERKRDACARAGIRLLEWRYDEPITVERVRRRLQEAGVVPLE